MRFLIFLLVAAFALLLVEAKPEPELKSLAALEPRNAGKIIMKFSDKLNRLMSVFKLGSMARACETPACNTVCQWMDWQGGFCSDGECICWR